MRKTSLAVPLLVLIAGGPGPGPGAADSLKSSMFRGDPAHVATYDQPTGLEVAGLQWRVDTDGSVISTPAVLGDTAWVGSADGRLYAIDRATGSVRWKVDGGSPIVSSPAVGRGRVVIGTRDGRFHAFHSSTGKRLWTAETGAALPFPWGHESGDSWTASAVLVENLAIVGGGDGKLYALDAGSGAVRWRAVTQGRVRSTPAVAQGRVFVGSADGRLYCFDLATGAARWRFDTEGVGLESGKFGYDRRTIQSSPAVSGNTVLIGARDGFLYAVSADAGKELWRFDYKISWINASPAVAGGVVYVGTSDGHYLNALDLATGKELWRALTVGSVWSSTAVTEALVIVGDGSGRIMAFDRKTGAPRWTFTTGGPVLSSPVPAGTLVLVGSGDGGVYAIRTAGSPVLRAVFSDTTGPVKAQPAEANLARFLVERGYQALGGPGLTDFLEARSRDRAPSVVVFAMDDLPAEVVSEPFERSLLRRYLDGGGKVVWVGMPPLLWPRDPKTGQRGGLGRIQWDNPDRLLGLRHRETIFDQRMVVPTVAGARWGLSLRWRDSWGIDPGEVTEVLGYDDWRLAAAWVKSFGGPRGTGFVRVPGDDPRQVYLAAEYRPLDRP